MSLSEIPSVQRALGFTFKVEIESEDGRILSE